MDLNTQKTMKTPDELNRHIGMMFIHSFRISSPIGMLHVIREKIGERGYQNFDTGDILKELGLLQKIMTDINNEMLQIHNLIKK
jgi:hypothetical protein